MGERMIETRMSKPISTLSRTVEACYEAAAEETGVEVSFVDTVMPALSGGRVVLAYDCEKCVGFLQFVVMDLPDTGEKAMIERMLYVLPEYRGSGVASALLRKAERNAKITGCSVMLAGSSLQHNEAARSVYEGEGFTTNYSFRKEIADV